MTPDSAIIIWLVIGVVGSLIARAGMLGFLRKIKASRLTLSMEEYIGLAIMSLLGPLGAIAAVIAFFDVLVLDAINKERGGI